VTLGSNTTQVSIRPNPVTNGTIYITSPFTSQILVNVYTITGQLLQRYNVAGKSEYIINLPASALAANSIVIETIGQAGTQTFTLLIR
jgi:hypothetical protein